MRKQYPPGGLSGMQAMPRPLFHGFPYDLYGEVCSWAKRLPDLHQVLPIDAL